MLPENIEAANRLALSLKEGINAVFILPILLAELCIVIDALPPNIYRHEAKRSLNNAIEKLTTISDQIAQKTGNNFGRGQNELMRLHAIIMQTVLSTDPEKWVFMAAVIEAVKNDEVQII